MLPTRQARPRFQGAPPVLTGLSGASYDEIVIRAARNLLPA